MAKLITKFKYLKPNARKSVGGYAKYIATREGVERIDQSYRLSPSSQKQQQLIEEIIKDFPDSKEMLEYEDYLKEPTVGNASEFITRALEDNAYEVMQTKTYADYIATRPRAERFGSHGLFTDDGVRVKLGEVSDELNHHDGNVWTVIISRRREDAERLGYNNGERWRDMLRTKTNALAKFKPTDYPIMEDFYKLCEEEFMTYDKQRRYLYTEQTLQEVCLGIHSMCVGSESVYFNGYSNITDDAFLVFGVKGLMDTNKRLKDAMLFNILSYMSNQLLGVGNTAASIDELYLFLTNMTAIEYIRNASKRVHKKESSVILASQNIEDFLIPSIREFTKPLFSIPTHQFLFNAGQINPKEYMDALQVEPSEFELIKYPERGTCLYRCGNERYLLQVIAPEYKSAIFGKAGGR